MSERFVDCDRCDERFVGERAIRTYLREQPSGRTLCVACLQGQTSKAAERRAREIISARKDPLDRTLDALGLCSLALSRVNGGGWTAIGVGVGPEGARGRWIARTRSWPRPSDALARLAAIIEAGNVTEVDSTSEPHLTLEVPR